MAAKRGRGCHAICLIGLTTAAVLGGCGPSNLGEPVPTPASTSAAPTSAPATTAAAAAPATTAAPTPPTTVAGTPPSAVSQSTTVATPPPGQVAGPTTPPARPSQDWRNHSYSINCLGAGGPVTLVNGSQEASEQNGWIWASLESVQDVNGGTIVMLSCEASAQVNGYHAVLVGSDGVVDDDLDIGPVESIDGMSYVTPSPEGWEPVELSYQAASVQAHTLSASGGRLNVQDGAVTPKCAPMGIELPSLGRPAVSEGNLIRELQRRLIELGYGGPINASGGVDGVMGSGTIQAFNQYFGDNWDYTDLSSPAAWYGDYESGEPIPYWLDIGWTEILDLNCTGTYEPTVE